MLLGQHCSMLSTILFGIVTPDCGLIQAQQYCSILLTTRNNVAPTTLLHPVFNNLLQLIIFCRVAEISVSENVFVESTKQHLNHVRIAQIEPLENTVIVFSCHINETRAYIVYFQVFCLFLYCTGTGKRVFETTEAHGKVHDYMS